MSSHFDASSDELGAIGIDLTATGIVATVVSVLIGTAAVGIIAVLMLL